MQMLERAGDFVSQDIWQRVVQLVTNNEGMQQYAAKNVADVLARGVAHEVSLLAQTHATSNKAAYRWLAAVHEQNRDTRTA